jgi:serine/threonine-protein kinase
MVPLAQATVFGKYRLFSSIGRGGMADVCLAVARGPRGLHKLAVVKTMRTGLAAEQADFVGMFLDEARLATRLNHPNIVHTYEIGEKDGSFFIVMEFLEGQSLRRLLDRAQKRGLPIPLSVRLRIMTDVLAGLHHAHDLCDYDGTPLCVVHRDVSPPNIFLTYDGVAKVVDFGVAKARSNVTQTEVGVLKGKVGYMSPEQASSGAVDRRSDVFSIGVVLWELLTGQRLFRTDAALALHGLLYEPIPPPSDVASGIDAELERIVMRALARDRDERWPTAEDMRVALERYARRQSDAFEPSSVGRLVSAVFQDSREKLRRQIEQQLLQLSQDAEVPPAMGSDPPRPSDRSADTTSAARGTSSDRPWADGSLTPSPEVLSAAASGARSKHARLWLLLCGAGILAMFALTIVALRSFRTARVTPQTVAEPPVETPWPGTSAAPAAMQPVEPTSSLRGGSESTADAPLASPAAEPSSLPDASSASTAVASAPPSTIPRYITPAWAGAAISPAHGSGPSAAAQASVAASQAAAPAKPHIQLVDEEPKLKVRVIE